MTTLAKVEANRLNGQLSTGPRMAEGKAAVARNATRHGIFSNVPVIPGECPEDASELAGDAAVPSAAAEGILEAACARAETAEGVRTDPPGFGSKGFLRKLGLAGADPGAVEWTAGLVRRGLLLYAGYAGEPAEQFAEEVRSELEESAEELGRKVRRLEREAGAVEWLLEGKAARRQEAKLLPGDGREERIAKYERHLHSLLSSTLHELERLQTRREGEAVPPPTVADLNVTVDTGPG